MQVKRKSKTIIAILVVILAVSGCYLFFYINKQNENINLLINSRKQQATTLVSFYTQQVDLQYSARIQSFVKYIQENMGLSTALVLVDAHDTEGMENSAVTVSGKYTLFPYDDPFFTSKADEIKITGEEQLISYNDSTMIVFPSYIIRDINGEEIGRLLQAFDLTQIRKAYKDDLIKLSLITLTVLVIASLILYLSFNKLFSELVRLNESLNRKNEELVQTEKQLEDVVAERTDELEEINVQLNREIERRQDANLSLTKSIEEWQSTFDSITDSVTILDKDLEVVIANKASHELLDRADDEIVGRKCHELFAGNPSMCDACPTMDIRKNGEQREYEFDHTFLGKNLHVICAPIFDGDDFLGFVHTARDITQEKKLKKQLAQAQKMEAIATLAGGIAHDFNNILGAILGNADLLLYRLNSKADGEDTKGKINVSAEDIGSHLEAIKKAGNRAKDLVGQILAFSRQGKSQRQNARITPVIKEGVKLLRSSLPANIEIKTSIDPETCRVHVDLTQVHQVFMNLCTNASQAMEEHGGILDISLSTVEYGKLDRVRYPDIKPGRYVVLVVKDTGHGMTPEIMERIFDPFFTTKDVSEGTGMGLAVIHGIITAHGGELDVLSTPGEGAEFTVFLPCVDGTQDTPEDAVLGVPRGNEKILFVDDEEDIVRMTTRMLEYLGYTVYPASSAEQAMAMLSGESFYVDLVITDYSMPGHTGVQLARDLMDSGKDIPVILCSGFSDSVILDQEARQVIRKFMSKPLDMKKLAFTVREVLATFPGENNANSDN